MKQISGIFRVSFSANRNRFGEGLAVISKNIINGGDHAYLYQGEFIEYGDQIRAEIDVKHYHGSRNSVLGSLQSFRLLLEGNITESSFSVTGGIPEHPNLRITINGQRVAELRQ